MDVVRLDVSAEGSALFPLIFCFVVKKARVGRPRLSIKVPSFKSVSQCGIDFLA